MSDEESLFSKEFLELQTKIPELLDSAYVTILVETIKETQDNT